MFSSTTESTPTGSNGDQQPAAALAEKEAKLKEVSDSYLRLLADMENLRARTKKEVEAASQFAVTKFAKDVISVADVMEMALKSVDPEHPLLAGPAAERAESDVDSQATPNPPNGEGIAGKYEQLIKGLGMTLEEVRKVLKKHGVVPIEPLHQRFDPNLHNALFQVPTADAEAGVVVSVAKKGYLLHHRVLRAADVGVSKKP
jgi:molecular chaperone GrpE